MRLQNRLIIGQIITIVVLVLAINYILHYILEDMTKSSTMRDIENSFMTYYKIDQQQRSAQIAQVRSIAQIPFLKATLAIPDVDTNTLQHASNELRHIGENDLIIIADSSGKKLLDLSVEDRKEFELSSFPGVSDALEGKDYYGMWRFNEDLYQVAITPSLIENQIIGIVIIGNLIERNEIISLIKNIYNVQMLFQYNEDIYLVNDENSFSFNNDKNIELLVEHAKNNNVIERIFETTPKYLEISGAPYYVASKVYKHFPGSVVFYKHEDKINPEFKFVYYLFILCGFVAIGIWLVVWKQSIPASTMQNNVTNL